MRRSSRADHRRLVMMAGVEAGALGALLGIGGMTVIGTSTAGDGLAILVLLVSDIS